MAAECNHRLVCKFQANVAVEASRSHLTQWAWFSSNYSAKANQVFARKKRVQLRFKELDSNVHDDLIKMKLHLKLMKGKICIKL
ncbi:hypothetical protein LguiA_014999 [Lonicera macranthoides]